MRIEKCVCAVSIIALHTQRRNDVCVHVHVMKQEPMKSNDVTTNKLSFPLFHPHFVVLCFLASFAHSLARRRRRRRFHSISQSLTQLRCRFLFFSISVIDTSAHCIQRISFPFYRFRHNIGVDCTLLGYPRW